MKYRNKIASQFDFQHTVDLAQNILKKIEARGFFLKMSLDSCFGE